MNNHHPGYDSSLTNLSKALRATSTRFEKKIWYNYLCKHPLHFYRQRPIDRYIADFYCEKIKLVIEIDGSQHLSEEAKKYDEERTEAFKRFGIEVIRFSNEAIDRQFVFVRREIDRVVEERYKELFGEVFSL